MVLKLGGPQLLVESTFKWPIYGEAYSMGMATQFPPEGFGDYEYLEMIVASKDSLDKYHDFHYNKQVDSIKYETMKRCK